MYMVLWYGVYKGTRPIDSIVFSHINRRKVGYFSVGLLLEVLLSAGEDEACDNRLADAGAEDALGFAWVLDLDLGVLGDHEHTHSLELLDGQETTRASMSIY